MEETLEQLQKLCQKLPSPQADTVKEIKTNNDKYSDQKLKSLLERLVDKQAKKTKAVTEHERKVAETKKKTNNDNEKQNDETNLLEQPINLDLSATGACDHHADHLALSPICATNPTDSDGHRTRTNNLASKSTHRRKQASKSRNERAEQQAELERQERQERLAAISKYVKFGSKDATAQARQQEKEKAKKQSRFSLRRLLGFQDK